VFLFKKKKIKNCDFIFKKRWMEKNYNSKMFFISEIIFLLPPFFSQISTSIFFFGEKTSGFDISKDLFKLKIPFANSYFMFMTLLLAIFLTKKYIKKKLTKIKITHSHVSIILLNYVLLFRFQIKRSTFFQIHGINQVSQFFFYLRRFDFIDFI